MSPLSSRVLAAVNRDRLLDAATRLVAAPSKTGEARPALDCLTEMLEADAFKVERPAAGHPKAPAVVARVDAKKPGKTIQFNGHLDTVHLPFVPPRMEGDLLRGSGSADMKAGTAAAFEAMRALRDAGALEAGAVLLTAHDLHETPWGDGSQLNQMIREGIHGDAVLIPEYLHAVLPVIGRGGLTWKARVHRPGAPVHEVMRPAEPDVIETGARLVTRLLELDRKISSKRDERAGPESLFIGQIHSGEIFNQYPQECRLEGTRRWLPGTQRTAVEEQFLAAAAEVAQATGATIDCEFHLMRDAFLLDPGHPFVAIFQKAYEATAGKPLPLGAKPFCDDGNSFWALADVPAITHGPKAGGAHTLEEWVSIEDLVRVAKVYALTALGFCGAG